MRAGVWLGAAAGLLLAAARLGAQTLPLPGLPTQPDTFYAGRRWEYALGAGAGWDSNLDFLIPNGPSELALTPRGGVARVFWSPHGRLRATAAGGLIGYPEQNELHRYGAEIGLDGEHRRSPSTEWRGNASYGLGYSDTSRILIEQGVLLPLLVKTRSVVGGVGLTRKMGPRRSLRMDWRYYRTEFATPRFIDGHSMRATFGLERRVSMRGTAAIEYSLEDVLSDQVGRSYLTHFGSLQWTSVLTQRSALLLEVGASYTPDAVRAGLEQNENFFGGLSFRRRVRASSLMFFARREVTPAFGIGISRMELRAGLGATVPMGRDWELRTMATHVQPETRQEGARAYPTSVDAFAVLARGLGRRLELSAEARYRRRGATSALPLVQALQVSLFLTLQSPSWKSIAPAVAR